MLKQGALTRSVTKPMTLSLRKRTQNRPTSHFSAVRDPCKTNKRGIGEFDAVKEAWMELLTYKLEWNQAEWHRWATKVDGRRSKPGVPAGGPAATRSSRGERCGKYGQVTIVPGCRVTQPVDTNVRGSSPLLFPMILVHFYHSATPLQVHGKRLQDRSGRRVRRADGAGGCGSATINHNRDYRKIPEAGENGRNSPGKLHSIDSTVHFVTNLTKDGARIALTLGLHAKVAWENTISDRTQLKRAQASCMSISFSHLWDVLLAIAPVARPTICDPLLVQS
ncbi:hypothetical protein BV25DRAFT_1926782 [Artomyces pyxidatus]|uniref:Uncharacterized protein n=1 Tax=Artomyces pyxidatus TaxID=48021 RepID=A0ACB8TLK2_9AGAM|nr:hypothetical protein BV25DRAFT_1926782 [Artomyces pyxidatus]